MSLMHVDEVTFLEQITRAFHSKDQRRRRSAHCLKVRHYLENKLKRAALLQHFIDRISSLSQPTCNSFGLIKIRMKS